MAYTASNLSLLAYGGGFSLWYYTTPDVSTVVDTSGYFNSAVKMLNKGDMIFAATNTGGTPAYGIFVVVNNTGTVVDVADLNSLGGTNTR